MQEGLTTVQIVANGQAVAAFLGYLLLLLIIGVYSSRFSSQGVSEFLYELIPAFSLAFLACLVVSRFTRPPSHTRQAMAAMKKAPGSEG